MIGSREFLDKAFRSRHLKGITQSRDHMVRHMLIALGEAVIELTLNLIEQKVRRVLLVSDDANAVKRGRRLDPARVMRGDGGDLPATHAVPDTAHGTGFDPALGVKPSEHASGILRHHLVGEMIHPRPARWRSWPSGQPWCQ